MKSRISKQLTFPLAGIIFMVMAIVMVSIQIVSLGSKLMQIEKQISLVEAENRQIMSQMIEQTALNHINAKAEKLGMVKPSEIYYLGEIASTLSRSVAQLP